MEQPDSPKAAKESPIQTPPVPHDEDEREPMFIQPHDPDYVPRPMYPDYIPLEDDHVLLDEEKPLTPVVSPTAESPEYVAESNPEEDPEEYEDDETEDGSVEYPMDGGDDGDKTGLGYVGQMNKSDLNDIHMNDSEVLNNVFDSHESDGDDNKVNDRFKKGEGYHAVSPPYTGNYMPPRPDVSFVGLDNSVFKSKVSETVTSVPKIETNASKTSKGSFEKPKTVRSSAHIIQDWEPDSEDENVFKPKEVKKTVKPSLEKIEFVNARNTTVENENKVEKPRKFTAVLTKSRQVPVNAAKQSSHRAATSVSAARRVNTATSRPNENNALPTTYSYSKAHSPVKRPFNQKSAAKTNNFNEKVNTAKVNNVPSAGPKAVVSAVEGNGNNAVKSSAGWIWIPKGNLIDHVSKDSGSYTLKRFNYVDPQGRFKSKHTESEGFEQIIDFLNAIYVKYALTINLTVYTSCIEQFWATAKVKNVNGEAHIQALVDKRKVIITEASIRRDLSTVASAIICLAINKKFKISKYIFDNMVKHLDGGVKFLMYPRFVQVFLDNQVEGMDRHTEIFVISSHTKKVFANMKREGKDFSGSVASLFRSMMKKQKSRRKQRKEIEVPSPSSEIPNEEGVPINSNDPLPSEDMFRVNDLDGDEVIVEVIANENTLIEIQAAKPKVITTAATTVSAAGTRTKEKEIVKKDQIMIDEEVAKNLEAHMQAELEEKERLARLKEKEETNIDFIESWDNTQAMMDTDCELAARLQEEERGKLSIEEKSRLFVELMNRRKKYFARLRAKKIRKIQMLFNNTMKWIEAFVPMDTKLVKDSEKSAEGSDKAVEDSKKSEEASSKRARSNLEQGDAKRQRSTKKGGKAISRLSEQMVEDNIWKYQQGTAKVLNWKLFDSCGVYCVTTKNMVDYEVEMAYDLLRLIGRQINEGYVHE
uniref:Uncharacterized protein n=1 Tax=Tanacetum cinerariifolium TaxID=118510 RepID=A0A6L2MNE4_TANCI|nr:hypothetical protein [Tanacetum cinerariifolium]